MAARLDHATLNSRKTVWGPIRKLLFGISTDATTFAARGFRGGAAGAREHLEKIGPAFTLGYHAALENDQFKVLVPKLQAVNRELQGFAFEGAAMASHLKGAGLGEAVRAAVSVRGSQRRVKAMSGARLRTAAPVEPAAG